MHHQLFRNVMPAALLVFGACLHAQTTVPAVLNASQTYTTGVVGVGVAQNARLNVLNLTHIPATANAAVIRCAVELQFVDAQDKALLSGFNFNVAPGTATSLVLKPSAVTSTATPSQLIRGVFITNPPNPSASPVATTPCNWMATLEVFDSASGETKILTSDVRLVVGSLIVPLAMTR